MAADVAIIVFELNSCEPGNWYDRSALYDDYDEMTIDMRKELANGRNCMIEQQTMMQSEFEALPNIAGMQTHDLLGNVVLD